MTLEIAGLTKRYGGLLAVNDVALSARPGQVTSVIGPNGAGKTTLLNMISGAVLPDKGSARLGDHDITALLPHDRAELGLTRTYQTPQLFEDMSVIETVMVGAHLTGRSRFWSAMLRLPFVDREEAEMERCARRAIDRVGLPGDIGDREALELPYGYQRRVEIARALAMEPHTLLLDEPAAGLNNKETEDIAELIAGLARQGMTIVLVEHDMHMVMGISHQIMVMNFGNRIAMGAPAEIQRNEQVIDAYLGAPKAKPAEFRPAESRPIDA